MKRSTSISPPSHAIRGFILPHSPMFIMSTYLNRDI
uniref:Uncharacterized protein n=1 Tax=Picea glauca TaxID=3330 RepID=A0A101M5G8_PICGL|nr:hypothetical protein ABT39_MTgene1068 [Picea glauca]